MAPKLIDLLHIFKQKAPSVPTVTSQAMEVNNSIDLTVNPNDSFRKKDDPILYPDKSLLTIKPVSHSPKISPSSIPNPNPSITETKQVEPFSNYSNYLYSIPGYSAFQPIGYPGYIPPSLGTQNSAMTSNQSQPPIMFQVKDKNETLDTSKSLEKIDLYEDNKHTEAENDKKNITKTNVETKMSISSLIQGSGATVTMSSTVANDVKKHTERFSLKTSIPISKIDIKAMNPPDTNFLNANKRITIHSKSAFQPVKSNESFTNEEAQKNSIIKITANNDLKISETKLINTSVSNSINALISAAEVINNEAKIWKHKDTTVKETQTKAQNFSIENKPLTNKPADGIVNDQKNKILLIQNKNTSSKMLVISPPQNNSQVLLPRTNYDQKNLLVPSRPSSLNRKLKDGNDNNSSKVVALKRTHQGDCDENDFENLITENQIYGNKIVVKEKLNNSNIEHDKKQNKIPTDRSHLISESKNVMLQPNFVYLSNVKFPGNLMMIKNNKINKAVSEQNKQKFVEKNKDCSETKLDKNIHINNNTLINKEIHVIKSNNNLLQSLSNQHSKGEFVFQTNQKVIMNSQILYQVPMLVENDERTKSSVINKECAKYFTKDQQPTDKKLNEKLYIACPYQMDSKLQPKIVITNIRPKVAAIIEEVSTLDLYEKRKRMRRLKHLSNKDIVKVESKKNQEKIELKNVITPDKVTEEISKEFAKTKMFFCENSSDSDSEYEDKDINEYIKIIKTYKLEQIDHEQEIDKKEFLTEFRLADKDDYKEKLIAIQERSLEKDSIASAYITAGRIDKIATIQLPEDTIPKKNSVVLDTYSWDPGTEDNDLSVQKKRIFLHQLQLLSVSDNFKRDFNKTWDTIIKDRKRRNGTILKDLLTAPNKISKLMKIDTKDQLKFLTEIKNTVHETNTNIKKRFGCTERYSNNETIHEIARKSFTELSKLSKMADRSLKLISGQDTKELNFECAMTQPLSYDQSYPINIPDVSKIISLKFEENCLSTSTPATFMDETYSATGTKDIDCKEALKDEGNTNVKKDPIFQWPGVDVILQSYRQFEIDRKQEISELVRRNTQLRVECARANRSSARESELARTLLVERQALANEERKIAISINRILEIIHAIKMYQ